MRSALRAEPHDPGCRAGKGETQPDNDLTGAGEQDRCVEMSSAGATGRHLSPISS
jgi:hypothetical protein